LAVTAASPCIDAGRDTSDEDFGDVTLDIEGTVRGFDGTAVDRGDGSDYDVGAFEFTP